MKINKPFIHDWSNIDFRAFNLNRFLLKSLLLFGLWKLIKFSMKVLVGVFFTILVLVVGVFVA